MIHQRSATPLERTSPFSKPKKWLHEKQKASHQKSPPPRQELSAGRTPKFSLKPCRHPHAAHPPSEKLVAQGESAYLTQLFAHGFGGRIWGNGVYQKRLRKIRRAKEPAVSLSNRPKVTTRLQTVTDSNPDRVLWLRQIARSPYKRLQGPPIRLGHQRYLERTLSSEVCGSKVASALRASQ